MGHIFISYSSKDRDIALKLANDLKDSGRDVWIDRWKITGREPYWDEIQEGIEGCSYFLFLVSPDSIDKESGARKELFHVASLKPGPEIIPALIRATPYNLFPIVISPGEYQIHDFVTQPYDVGFANIVRAMLPPNSTAQMQVKDVIAAGKAQTRPDSPTVNLPQKRSPLPVIIGVAVVAVLAVLVVGALLVVPRLGKSGGPTVPPSEDPKVVAQASTGTSVAQTSTAVAIGGLATLTEQSRVAAAASATAASQRPSPTSTWTVTPSLTPFSCPGFVPSRLEPRGKGRVTPGSPNNVRAQPDTGSRLQGQITAGTVFDILLGPQCSKDGVWWLIRYADGVGWTVEGNNSAYYLEPMAEDSPEVAALGLTQTAGTPVVVDTIAPTDVPVNTPTLTPTLRFTPTASVTPTVTPQGGGTGKIAYTAKVGDVYQIFLANSDGTGPVNITNTSTNEYSPAWSPDGQKLAFVSERDGNPQIYVMAVDGSNLHHIAPSSSKDLSPAWSADNKNIAFASNRTGNFDIYLIDQSGSALRRITFNNADDLAPSWSPDGKEIVFVSNRNKKYELFILDNTTTNLTSFTSAVGKPVTFVDPVWSPVGQDIAYVSDGDGQNGIYIQSVKSNVARRIPSQHPVRSPAWSPDGLRLLYLEDTGSGMNLVTMDAKGEPSSHLIIANVAPFAPAWQPSMRF